MTTNFKDLARKLSSRTPEEMTLEEYIEEIKVNKSLYNTPAQRMVAAFGAPEYFDSSQDSRLRIIHENQTIALYKPFERVFGAEVALSRLISYFTHAAQGLEEGRQILALRGPVSSGKSQIAEILKTLMEQEPIYVLSLEGVLSPVYESPLGLFPESLSEELNVPSRVLRTIPSPWAIKRADELTKAGKDISEFKVIKMYPDKLRQIAISKTEPGDENNQDISTLVGKVNLRKLSKFDQSDPDAYDFSGALCKANQGLLEYVEMFKAPIQTLNPLLTATQEGNYKGTEALNPIPFAGLIVSHFNDTEWEAFRNNKKNEAILDRVFVCPVGYNLRVKEEVRIYKKLLADSTLKDSPCAPGTLEALAEFSILSRLEEPKNSSIITKMKVYDGQDMKGKTNEAKSISEYREAASRKEGFEGVSTRFAFKALSAAFNLDRREVAADPVTLIQRILPAALEIEALPVDYHARLINFIESYLRPKVLKNLEDHIKEAYVDAYEEYGQNTFDQYVAKADARLQRLDFKDPDTGYLYNSEALDQALSTIESKAHISNVLEFRQELVDFCLRYRASHNGANPSWRSYEPIKKVIDANLGDKLDDLLPVISVGSKANKSEQSRHDNFLNRMLEKGYTEIQVKRMVEFYKQAKVNSKIGS